MKNKLLIVLVIFLNILFQATVFSRISVFGVYSNLSLAVVVALSIGFGSYTGGYSGLIIGLVEDILFSPVIGVRALIYFILGFLIGSTEAGINKEDPRSGIIFTIGGTLFYYLIYTIVFNLIGEGFDILAYLMGPIFLEILLNLILYLICFTLFKKIFKYPRFRL